MQQDTTLELALPRRGGWEALGASAAVGVCLGRTIIWSGLPGDPPRGRPAAGAGVVGMLRAVALACRGRLRASVGSTQASLVPGEVCHGTWEVEARGGGGLGPVGGAVGPLAGVLGLARGESEVVLVGGTNVAPLPTAMMLARVVSGWVRRMGVVLEVVEVTPGFLPRCRGEMMVRVGGRGWVEPLRAEDAFRPRRVEVEVLSSRLPAHLGEGAQKAAMERLSARGYHAEGKLRRASSGDIGLVVLARAVDSAGRSVGFSAIGRRGGRPEAVGVEVAERLVEFLGCGAALPAWVAAQLIPVMAVASGVNRFSVDGLGAGLKAALEAVAVVHPGSVLITPRREGGAEIRLKGAGAM